jgi:hypothetical protein
MTLKWPFSHLFNEGSFRIASEIAHISAKIQPFELGLVLFEEQHLLFSNKLFRVISKHLCLDVGSVQVKNDEISSSEKQPVFTHAVGRTYP